MDSSQLQILITAVDNASSVLQGVSAQLGGMSGAASSASSSITDSLQSVRSAALQVGAVAGTAFAGLAEEIKSASAINEDWNLSFADIANTLKDTGSSLPISQIEAFAESLSNSTLFSQQQVASSEQLVVGNKSLQSSFESILHTSADLAAHIGTDLPDATAALMKVLNDPATAVTRLANAYNIDLGPALIKTITAMGKAGDIAGAQAAIMKGVEDQIGGAAEAARDASGTGFDKMTNSVQVLQNATGSGLNPMLDQLWGKIAVVVNNVAAWVDAHPKLTAAILITLAAITGIVAAIAGFVAIVASIGIAIAVLVDSPIALLLAAAIAIGTGIGVLLVNWKSTWASIVEITTGAIQEIIYLIQQAINWIDQLLAKMASSGLGKAVSAIGGGIGSLVSGAGAAIGGVASAIGLASGGIVTSPTFALIGEAGPEAVVPLSGLGSGASFGGNGAININIGSLYGTDSQAAMQFANQVAKAINTQLRLRTY